ncbi:hypothetical protein HDA40_007068 [Hamadaea flava]|uniref:Uncharacterized protein n=1 Tax=Hamadaea flava TaxID=1742688 RepID=A0ABV8M2S3_9ACTN|nr:hypothetical protein [Hamadaea flava]MCP2328561.1 hypothetical protein [Hamadaea flava]
MDSTELQRLHRLVIEFLGDVAVDVLDYPTGAIALTIYRHSRVAVLDGMADRSQWGVTVITEPEFFHAGYDQVFETLAEALAYLRDRT